MTTPPMPPPEDPKGWTAQERQVRPFMIVASGLIALFELVAGSYWLAARWAMVCGLQIWRTTTDVG